MAESVTESKSPGFGAIQYAAQIKRLKLDYVTASGSASVTVADVNGVILRVTTNPGATAPTDNWDIALLDEDGIDVLGGDGVDRDTANSESFCPSVAFGDGFVPVAVSGSLTLNITNAGDAKVGSVIVYLR